MGRFAKLKQVVRPRRIRCTNGSLLSRTTRCRWPLHDDGYTSIQEEAFALSTCCLVTCRSCFVGPRCLNQLSYSQYVSYRRLRAANSDLTPYTIARHTSISRPQVQAHQHAISKTRRKNQTCSWRQPDSKLSVATSSQRIARGAYQTCPNWAVHGSSFPAFNKRHAQFAQRGRKVLCFASVTTGAKKHVSS